MRFIYTKTFTRLFTVFVILAVLAIFDAQGYLGLAKDGFFRVFGATTHKVTEATNGVKNIFFTFATIKNLVHENAALSQQVDELSFENARLQSAQNENSGLRAALNFKQQSKLNLLPVEVLTADPTGFSQIITLDKGKNYQIHLGQPVVAAPGLLIGKITKVYPNSTEVTLITDPAVVVNAEVVDSAARGLVRGEHGLTLSMDLVTQNELIKTGDRVITSALSGDFPRGLLIGEVSSIRSTNTDLFQKAYVTPAADLRNLRFLYIVQ